MTDEELKERLDSLEESLEALNDSDFENFSTYTSISNAIHIVHDLKKTLFTPTKPETCDGFIDGCDRKPSKYYGLKKKWLCVKCWNEHVAHYSG